VSATNGHPGTGRLQDWLDGALPPAAAADVASHVRACPACTRDVALYRQVFAALDAVPLPETQPWFSERVLDRVLPSRVRQRRRRLRIFGWGYAGLAALCAGGALVIARVPAAHLAAAQLSVAVSRGALQAGVFLLDAVSAAALRVLAVWGLLQAWLGRLAPLGRALGDVLRQPALLLLLMAAISATAVVLWWMRPRAAHAAREVRHVGLLGF
jgi:putative zinc finger protein